MVDNNKQEKEQEDNKIPEFIKVEKIDEKEVKELVSKGWYRIILLFEIVGKPAKHIEQSLELVFDHLSNEKKLKLVERKVHPAKEYEGNKEFFATFGEIELVVEGFMKVVELVLDFFPSSIEILEPSKTKLELNEANSLLNDLTHRLHSYDVFVKKLKLQNELLVRKLQSSPNQLTFETNVDDSEKKDSNNPDSDKIEDILSDKSDTGKTKED